MIAFPSRSSVISLPLDSGRATPARPAAGEARTDGLTKRDARAMPHIERAFRDMYTRALPELESGKHLVIGVTSAVRGEGRTTTALGLTLAIARDLEASVLLAELDFGHPSLARSLGLPERPGLVDVLSGAQPVQNAIYRLPPGGIDLLPVGSSPQLASRLLRSSALRQLLETARLAYGVTVLDLPPALSSSDVVPLSNLTDGVLLTVRAGVTPARLVEQAIARFAAGKVRGVILNGSRSRIPRWIRRFL